MAQDMVRIACRVLHQAGVNVLAEFATGRQMVLATGDGRGVQYDGEALYATRRAANKLALPIEPERTA